MCPFACCVVDDVVAEYFAILVANGGRVDTIARVVGAVLVLDLHGHNRSAVLVQERRESGQEHVEPASHGAQVELVARAQHDRVGVVGEKPPG